MIFNDLRYALNPVTFVSECLGIVPDPWQKDVLLSTSKRVILNCSRQSGKSTVAAMIALHRVLFYEGTLVLLISPSLRQSSELFRKVTDFLKRLPTIPILIEDNKLSLQLKNGARIISLPGEESNIRGYSNVNLIIEDEAARVSDDLYRAIRPMFAVSQGSLIMMSTPFGKRGHFYDEWQNGKGWMKVEIPANKCLRISKGFLEMERKSLGDWWYQQEYMCKFVETEDQLFNYDEVMNAIDFELKPLSIL
jgi:phage terminase large subunit-like protein